MAEMSPQEQLMLELINRARMDPNGEAKRFGIKLNEGVSKHDKISDNPKQVLAGNDDLQDAADDHSAWMLDHKFSHNEGKKDPGDRMEDAGYNFTGNWTWGENIAARSGMSATDAIIRQHKDLFVDKGIDGRGHRLNILNAAFQEIGIGQEMGGGTSMVTQDFARSGSSAFVTGVVYDDNDDDNFFSVGDETAGIDVSAPGAAGDTTGSGGGYELRFSAGAGATMITFDLATDVVVGLTVGARNIKLDVVNGDEVWTDSSLTSVSSHVAELHAFGLGKVNFDGADSTQAMYGNKAANRLDGNGGGDTLVGGRGNDELHGGSGADVFIFAKGDTGKTGAKADTIADFSQADNDVIDLTAWDANSRQANDQAFTFIDGAKFHKVAGELRTFDNGVDTFVQGDTNGDGKADFLIRLNGVVDLAGGDFAL
jgi:Ca2+-binding RTX toxin-like protein